MRTYASSRVKRKSFYRKSELQMFLLISGGHIGAPKRYKGAWNVSANNSETVGHKDWEKLFIYYHILYYLYYDCLYISLLNHFIFLASSTGRFPIYFFVAWQWKRSIVDRLVPSKDPKKLRDTYFPSSPLLVSKVVHRCFSWLMLKPKEPVLCTRLSVLNL